MLSVIPHWYPNDKYIRIIMQIIIIQIIVQIIIVLYFALRVFVSSAPTIVWNHLYFSLFKNYCIKNKQNI